MAIIGLSLETTTDNQRRVVSTFFNSLKVKLEDTNFIKNPFNSELLKEEQEQTTNIYIYIEPIYPNPFYLGLIFFLGGLAIYYLIFRSLFLFLPSLFLITAGIFYTDIFYFYMSRVGLKKIGYRGVISRIKKGEIARLYIGTRKNTPIPKE